MSQLKRILHGRRIVCYILAFVLLSSNIIYVNAEEIVSQNEQTTAQNDTTNTENEQTNTENGRTNTENGQANPETGQANSENGQTNSENGQTNPETGQTNSENGQTNSQVSIQAESAILLEASTGEVIFEKNPDVQLPPASITKIMTLILIFEAIDEGKLNLDEVVTVSEYAASMGGSQVFLEPMEQQTVDTMIKCIAVASANDACVAYRNSRQCQKPL